MLSVPSYLTPNGEEMSGFAGMTVSDLRLQFQDCWLVEAAHPTIMYSAGDYALIPGVLYQVIATATTQGEGTLLRNIPLAHFPNYNVTYILHASIVRYNFDHSQLNGNAWSKCYRWAFDQ